MNSKLDNLKLNNLKITKENLEELLHKFCYIKINNEIVINFENYKSIRNQIDNNYILNYLIFVFENA